MDPYQKWQVWIEFGTWVDVTSRVDTMVAPIDVTSGEQRETDDAAGSLTLVLDNSDQAFTPGNVNSPYYPYVKSRRRIRIVETIGYRTFELFTGWIDWPEIESWAASTAAAPRSQTITVSAIDQMGRWETAGKFRSNLGAHIKRYASGLVAYWPMDGAAAPFTSVASTGALPAVPSVYYLTWGTPSAVTGGPAVNPATQEGPPGEDVSFAQYEMEVTTVGGLLRPSRSMQTVATIPDGTIALAAGQVMTVVAWVRSPWTASDSESIPLNIIFTDSSGTGALTLTKQDGAGSTWLVEVTGSTTLSASFTGPVAPTDRWTLVGVRFGFTPNTIELWVDDGQTTGTLSGAAPTTLDVDSVGMPDGRFDGSIAHVQVYVGAASDWTFADQFTAQREMGLFGLEQQTSGERIRTVAILSGLTESELGDVDDGIAVMQRVSLAGQPPITAITEAVTTEQGSCYAGGHGRPVFHGRLRRYNI